MADNTHWHLVLYLPFSTILVQRTRYPEQAVAEAWRDANSVYRNFIALPNEEVKQLHEYLAVPLISTR